MLVLMTCLGTINSGSKVGGFGSHAAAGGLGKTNNCS